MECIKNRMLSLDPIGETKLLAFFADDDPRLYDVAPLMDKWSVFYQLRNPALFQKVKVDAGGYGISWNDDIDLSSDEIYNNGEAFKIVVKEVSRVVSEAKEARAAACVSQAQLGEASGIKQPVIARMESGKTIPRLDTLLKLLAPLGKTLKIVDLADEL